MPVGNGLDVRPLTPTIGAEVRGVDLRQPIPEDVVASLRAMWLDRLVLFFPDQHLTAEEQTTFARQFGEVTDAHPVEPALEDHPLVLPIDSAKDRTNFWHTDVTFMSRPPMASVLAAQTLPEVGGDTMWADTRAAYDALAVPLRRMCDDLVGIHFDASYARTVGSGGGAWWDGKRVEYLEPARHPVVRLHPETGRRNLFVNPGFTVGLEGFNELQGGGLLRTLYKHMTQPQFIVRYRWGPGTLALWDNRTTMHYGVYDYGDGRRVMHRVTLRGERPRGVVT